MTQNNAVVYDDISTMILEGKGKRGQKHNVTIDDGFAIITSDTFANDVKMPVDKLIENVPTIEILRDVVRCTCKRQDTKYKSSYQNVSDRLWSLLSTI